MSALMELVYDLLWKCRVPGDWKDAILVLVEKSWEHHSKVFLTFINLKKAYDSVPKEAWCARGDHLSDPVFSSRYTRNASERRVTRVSVC